MADRSSSRSQDALWERVENQGTAIRQLSDEVATSFREIRSETTRAFTDLAAQVKGSTNDAAAAYKGLEAKFEANAARMADASRPQYLSLFGAAVAAIGISVTIIQWQTGLHDKPVDDKISSLTQLISDLAHNTTTGLTELGKATVSQNEYKLTNDFRKQIYDQSIAARDAQFAALGERVSKLDRDTQADLDKLQAAVVSRNELTYHWDAHDKSIATLQAEIDKVNSRLDTLAPASDTIRTLIERQHEQELQIQRLVAGKG